MEKQFSTQLAMDDVVEGGIVLWDLAALCLRWRATGDSGFVADDNYICRKQLVVNEFVTTLQRVQGDRLENDYLVCGSIDGKCKVTLVSGGELVGQLVTDGDDAWSFLDGEPHLEEHQPQVDG